MKMSTIFETAARFTQNAGGSGTNLFTDQGLQQNTAATGTSYAENTWFVFGTNTGAIFAGSPVFSTNIYCANLVAASGAGSAYYGLGDIPSTGTAHTFTADHIGFKVLKASGTVSLYATQGDGTTENASAALTTLVDTDVVDLILKVNSTTSVDYYWRKSGGALSSATNLTSNMGDSTTQFTIEFSISNNATAFSYAIRVASASYER